MRGGRVVAVLVGGVAQLDPLALGGGVRVGALPDEVVALWAGLEHAPVAVGRTVARGEGVRVLAVVVAHLLVTGDGNGGPLELGSRQGHEGEQDHQLQQHNQIRSQSQTKEAAADLG